MVRPYPSLCDWYFKDKNQQISYCRLEVIDPYDIYIFFFIGLFHKVDLEAVLNDSYCFWHQCLSNRFKWLYCNDCILIYFSSSSLSLFLHSRLNASKAHSIHGIFTNCQTTHTHRLILLLCDYQSPENGTAEKRPPMPKAVPTTRAATNNNGSSANATSKTAGTCIHKTHTCLTFVPVTASLLSLGWFIVLVMC